MLLLLIHLKKISVYAVDELSTVPMCFMEYTHFDANCRNFDFVLKMKKAWTVIASHVCTTVHVSTLQVDIIASVYQVLKEKTVIVVSYMAIYFFFICCPKLFLIAKHVYM